MSRRPIRATITAFALVGILAGLLPASTLAVTGAPSPVAGAAAGITAASSTTPGSEAGRGASAKGRIAAGGTHSCLIAVDGTIRCWGANGSGQLGDGQKVSLGMGPTLVGGIVDAVAVAAGGNHTCAILAGGSVKCWGANDKGQIGENGGSGSALPVTVAGVSGAVALAAGTNHTCALLVGGTIKCWGSHEHGQLGNGSIPSGFFATPQTVITVTGATGIAAGAQHTCARLASGAMRCWGDDSSGQLGGSVPDDATATPTPIAVTGQTNVIDIAAGWAHTCAVLASGVARCWGANAYGQVGNGAGLPAPDVPTPVNVQGLANAVSIAAGGHASCAQVADGSTLCWGDNSNGQLGRFIDGTATSTPGTAVGLGGTVALAIGFWHACALMASGIPACWGANQSGQLGELNGHLRETIRILVEGRISPATIAAGSPHTCALNALGTVQCWGRNTAGELGINDASVTYALTPRQVYGLSGVLDISAGTSHTCALLRGGSIKCWGANNVGQLGNTGAGAKAIAPVDVMTLGGPAISISAGGDHTCAVLLNQSVRCWGGNTYGQLGDGTKTPRPTPVTVTGLSGPAARVSAGSSHTCAAMANGTAMCWGLNGSGQVGSGGTSESSGPQTVMRWTGSTLVQESGIVQVVARYAHSCALETSGAVVCWGWNGYGELGRSGADAPYIYGNVGLADRAIGIGPSSHHGVHTCAVLVTASVQCWGGNGNGELGNGTTSTGATSTPQTVQNLAGAAQVSVGFAHSCALLLDGTAKCWGFGGDGQLGNGSQETPKTSAVSVSNFKVGTRAATVEAGGSHSCALLGNGQVRCWGANGSGRLGDGTTSNRTRPVTVSGITGAREVSAGGSHTCALLGSGAVRCWGSNAYGQLGDTTLTNRPASVPVSGLTLATAITAGGNHTCALLANGTVKCWGRNTSGQLGDKTTTLRKAPVLVLTSSGTPLTNVTAISAGTDHTCAVLADGTARCWGAGGSGRLGDGSTTNRLYPVAVSGVTTSSSVTARFTAITAGAAHTCARTANGAAKCWGLNTSGRLGDGTTTTRPAPVVVAGLTGVVSISAGGSHSCAQLSAGSARCWGNGANGRLGTGSTASKTTPTPVSSLAGATGISAGGSHTCAVLGSGALRCWGLNSSGQLGNGTTTEALTPKAVSLI